MPTGPRPTSRPGAGPGRGRARARSASSAGSQPRQGAGQAERRPAASPAGDSGARSPGRNGSHSLLGGEAARRRSSLTTRAIALAVVFLILTISYATSLRIYFQQTAQIAATQQQIVERQTRIAELQTGLARWNDPDYVKAQARSRLGWVMPGEVGFRVVGEDGRPVAGGAEIERATKAAPRQDAWWDTMWGSVEAADRPAPAPSAKPSKPPTITEHSTPTPLPTPR